MSTQSDQDTAPPQTGRASMALEAGATSFAGSVRQSAIPAAKRGYCAVIRPACQRLSRRHPKTSGAVDRPLRGRAQRSTCGRLPEPVERKQEGRPERLSPVGYPPTPPYDQMPGRSRTPLITAQRPAWAGKGSWGRHLTCNFQCDPPKMNNLGISAARWATSSPVSI